MKNEKTSKRVASIAGRILKELKESDLDGWVSCIGSRGGPTVFPCTARELKALAASALTQTSDTKRAVRRAIKREWDKVDAVLDGISLPYKQTQVHSIEKIARKRKPAKRKKP